MVVVWGVDRRSRFQLKNCNFKAYHNFKIAVFELETGSYGLLLAI